ncbi:SdpI family protein [Streptomyces sp. OR43]|uniref:hypothetical protein n=1 Tax=Streptomyces sp. or43 TaxID=2478957 RepID=UPI0029059118|nr:hypothetical protein [Streptomyces sp. or43]
MNRKNTGRAALAALPFLLALAADLILFATRRDRLPGQLASHFVGNGRADDYAGRTSYVVITTVLLVGTGALWALMATRGGFHGRSYRRVVAFGYAVAGFLGYLMAVVLLVNVDAAEDAQGRAQDVSFPMWQLAAALGVAALAFGLGLLLAAVVPVPEQPPAGGHPDGSTGRHTDGATAGGERIALAARCRLPVSAMAHSALRCLTSSSIPRTPLRRTAGGPGRPMTADSYRTRVHAAVNG